MSLQELRQKLIISFLMILISQGCRSTISFDKPVTRSPAIYEVKPILISLSPQVRNLVEEITYFGYATKLNVGSAFSLCFQHDPNSNFSLDFVHSRIDVKASDILFFGTRWDSSYSITLKLKTEKDIQILNTHATGSSAGGSSYAAQVAVENAVYELYERIKAIQEVSKHDSTNESRNS